MYALRGETRSMLNAQHRALYEAIMEGRAEQARGLSNQHIDYVQEVLAGAMQQEVRELRAQRRGKTVGGKA
jgi:GntR family transcriptional repressor for pyruvate dehydrogenase complex